MKMYQIEPNDWSLGWCIMSNSAEEALQYLKNHLKKDADEEANGEYSEHFTDSREHFAEWENATVNNLPGKYYIREYNEGEIMCYENS
jgi:hypothetical protein